MNQTIVPNFIKKRAYLTPNRIALIYKGDEISFSELYEKALSTAERLTTYGIKKQDHIAVLLNNHIETVYILLGLQLIGCPIVLLNNRLTLFEIEWQLKDSDSKFLITDEQFQSSENILIPTILKKELIIKKRTKFELLEEINLSDICSIMYTSGTTGKPKGVLQSYGNHWWSATGSALNLGLNHKDRWICTVPLFHISGFSIIMRGLIYGMTVILHDGFDEKSVLDDIVKKEATIVSVVTTMLSRIIAQLNDNQLPASFRCMLVGGGPVPKSILEECLTKGVPVYQTYGMTETSSQVVTLSPEDSLVKLGSAGKPLLPVQLKIINPAGKEALPMEAGEIFIKGPNVTSGYLNQPMITEEKIQNGWLSTGDIGYLDEEGFLFVLDRRADLIISGGENIYPAEIEGVLLSHENIMDAGVIGVVDEKWGQVPISFVVCKGDITEKQLIDYCQGRMAKYKIPKRFIFVKELPRNAARKLMRHKLKELWENGFKD